MSDSDNEISVTVTGDPIPSNSVLLRKVREAVAKGSKKVNVANGFVVDTDSKVQLLMGPVLGNITETSAILMLEVTGPESTYPITVRLYKDTETDEPVDEIEEEVHVQRPVTFHFENLEPGTKYTAVVNGICKYHATNRMAIFQTKPETIEKFRFFALSCDRPSRLLLGQQNPWKHILKRIKDVDCVLHIGDQIYPDNEDIQSADKIFTKVYDDISKKKQKSMMIRGRELWRKRYRTIFSKEGKVDVLRQVSNLTIWSDNDVANDFTTMKNEDGKQAYHPNFLQCGMRTFREYQRRLWDHDCELALPENIEEWHSHIYGPIGIFMFDLRGNRINGEGVTDSDAPLISEAQWSDLEEFFATPELRVVILCSETPFVGDEPAASKEKVENESDMAFLKDHWPYNEEELVRLLDMCFEWKAAGEENGGRDVLLIGGDIHCGVTSVIRDKESGLQINHLTTSPVTNHVCEFFPPPQGNINDRYNFSHLPLGETFRNYADVLIQLEEDGVNVQAKLVPISTDIFKDTNWQQALDEEDED